MTRIYQLGKATESAILFIYFRGFKGARNRATFVMNSARCEYYTNLIAENSSNQRNLFRITKSLLCEPSEVSFPKDIAPDDLANDFGNFFMQKIDKINQLIDMQSSLEMSKAGKLKEVR